MAYLWNVALIAFSVLFGSTYAICYYPDGTPTQGDVPCLPGSEPSWCCGFGWTCLNNRLCSITNNRTQETAFFRGSCTDQSWRAANCPSFCVNPNPPYNDTLDGPMLLTLCPNTTNAYSCIDGAPFSTECKRGNIAVQATGILSAITTIGYGPRPQSSLAVPPDSPVSASYRTPVLISSTTSTSAPSRGSAAASTLKHEHTSSSRLSTPAIAGTAVGAVLGFLALVLAATLLLRRMRRNKMAPMPEEKPRSSPTTAVMRAHYEAVKFDRREEECAEMEVPPPSELDGSCIKRVSEIMG